ncbi:electron transport complex subunit RsxA [Buchnera aphidicola (Pemphigus obesinymphae)]|uniref:electron transport complex subunit RsxA n=1 Tax=Buchnera aphidicola TaxID=9 RepID=UPI002237CA71|nr:electron transport complex subunit RsxA [Buchnera aphidicola]MCW5196751.1 electron transport complex subunit RsxA [Buchnera aphidicola (Pemphigus obesinymphae)]
MIDYSVIFISNILINNFILVQFLGICPFIGASKRIESAIGISLATTFVITISVIISWLVNYYILVPCNMVYLRIIMYMLIISVSVQVIEIIIKKLSFYFYRLLGIFLPLITTNCVVLAIPLLNLKLNYGFIPAVMYGLSSSIGFSLVMILFSSMRERIFLADVPLPFKGSPIALVTAGLMSMSFMGFNGLIKF